MPYRSDDDDDDVDADTAIADKNVGANALKRKTPEESVENESTEDLDEKSEIQNDAKKVKVKQISPAKTPIGVPMKTSKGFIVEKLSEDTEKSKKQTTSSTNKLKPSPAKKKQKISAIKRAPTTEKVVQKKKILPTKKVPTTPKVTQKSPLATIPNKNQSSVKLKKTNTKSSLIKKGGITKKTSKPQKSTATTHSQKPSISDERLRAFGLNPKKFHKKLKYGNKSMAAGGEPTTTAKKVATKNSKLDKLNQKKIKQKLLKVLGR